MLFIKEQPINLIRGALIPDMLIHTVGQWQIWADIICQLYIKKSSETLCMFLPFRETMVSGPGNRNTGIDI